MQNDNTRDTDNTNTNPSSLLGDVPPQVKEQLSSWILSMRSEQRSGTALIAEKLNTEHIAALITNNEESEKRDFSAFKIEKFVGIAIFIISLIFALILLIVFRDSEHFITIITALFSFLGGLGVGRFVIPGKGDR
jgi:hypothetical protein